MDPLQRDWTMDTWTWSVFNCLQAFVTLQVTSNTRRPTDGGTSPSIDRQIILFSLSGMLSYKTIFDSRAIHTPLIHQSNNIYIFTWLKHTRRLTERGISATRQVMFIKATFSVHKITTQKTLKCLPYMYILISHFTMIYCISHK